MPAGKVPVGRHVSGCSSSPTHRTETSDLRVCSPPLGGAQSTLARGCAQLLSMGCQRASASVHVRRPEIAGDGRSADLAVDCARPRCATAAPCESVRPSPSPRVTGSGTRCLSQNAYGGIGPPAACDWLDSIFTASYTAEYLSGGTGQDTSHRRLVFYQSLHAALVRGCADMVEHLTPTSANLATAAAVDAAAAATTTHQPPTTPAP